MKIAYLVLAHRNPQLLKRAIKALSSENCAFFIHIDRKSNINLFSCIGGDNVHFSMERLPVYWGEFSQVQAVLLLLRQALESPQHYDYFVLLQGSDYPLRSGSYIHKFLEENRGLEFMDLVKMPAPGKPLFRINTVRYPSNMPVRRFAARVLAKMGFAQRDHRKYLGNLEPYSGGACWTLTRDACQYLLESMQRNPHVEKYFQNTSAPDEAFFHTILGNSPFRSRFRRSLVYADWSAEGAHPAMISEKHLELFELQDKICLNDIYGSGEVLLARKFSDENLDLVQRVDNMISLKENRETRRAAP
jgi:hypothetical protein